MRRPRTAACSVLALLLAAGGCTSLPPLTTSIVGAPKGLPAAAVLPSTLCGNVFLVSAHVEGRGPFLFLLDSGAPRTQLSRQLARSLGARDHLRAIDVGDLAIRGRIPFSRRDFGMLGQALGTEIDGILGYTLFADLLLTFDLPRATVRVRKGGLVAGTPGTVSMSQGDRPFVQARLGERILPVLVDTGFSGGISLIDFRDLPLRDEPRPVGVRVTREGLSVGWGARLDEDLAFGVFTVRQPIVTNAVRRNLIGQEILRHFVVTLDPASGLAHFGTPAGDPAPVIEMPPLHGSGLAVIPQADHFAVFDVFTPSPAADAGILPGDRVRSVDGVPVTTPRGCSERRRDGTEQPRVLTIERDGTRFDVTVANDVLVH